MDLWERVREIGDGQELEQERMDAARRTLLATIDEAHPRGIARGWIWGGVGGVLVAGAAAAAVVVALGSQPGVAPAPTATAAATPQPTPAPTPAATVVPTPEPVLTAAAVLGRVAALSASSLAPIPQAGQYLRIDRSLEYLATYGPVVDGAAPYGVPRDVATAAWLVRSSYRTYVPADRTGAWVRVFTPVEDIAVFYGTDAEAHASAWRGQILADPIVERFTGGLGYPGDADPLPGSDAYFAAMPREASALIAWQRARLHDAVDVEAMVVQLLVQDLEQNLAPADLRAAMFEALGLVEGVRIESVEGSVTTFGFVFDYGTEEAITLSVDTTTGLVVQSTATRAGGAGIVPAAVADYRVVTTFAVVDGAP